MATWRDVSRIARALPNTSEEMSHGNRSWLVDDKAFVWERPLRRGDFEALGESAPAGPILAVRTDGLEMKEALLGSNPKVYFTTPHFDGYPAVLVQLKKVALRELKDVMREAWLSRASKKLAAAFLQEQGLSRRR